MKRLYCPVTRATQGRMIGISGGDDYGGGNFLYIRDMG